MRLECKYDSRGNWIECRQVAESQEKKSITKAFRRRITYR